MKSLTRTLTAAAAAAAALACAVPAHAALIFNGSYTGGPNAYIGTYTSTAFDSGLFDNGTLGLGAFTNTWVFNFTPGGSATMNANFIPGFPNPNSIQNFNVALYSASTATPASCLVGFTSSTAGVCSGLSLGSLIASGINQGNTSSIPFTPLATGLYAIVVTGTVVGTPTLYSGQMTTTPVPEPTTLALVGLALCGVGATLRKRSA